MEPVALTLGRGDDRAFVFRYVAEDGAVGLFVPSSAPPAIGTSVSVRLPSRTVHGVVGWRNDESSDTPGVGVILEVVDDELVEALLTDVRAIAYLPREIGGS